MGARQKNIIIVAGLFLAIMAVVYAKHAKYQADVKAIGHDGMANIDPSLPTFLELGSDSCVPCKMMVPILKELKAEYAGKLNVAFIDVWKDEAAVDKYGVEVIPTQIIYDANGTEKFRHQAFFAKQDILDTFKKLNIDLKRGPEDEKNN